MTVDQQAKRVVIAPEPVPPITALGDQQSLTASAFDSLGFLVVAPNKTPGWATLDPTVVTVDRAGLVTGVGAGVGRVVAVVDAARDTAPITVGDVAASVVVQPKTATLASLKDTVRLSITVRNGRGNVIQNPAITWHTPDPTVVRLDTTSGPLAIAVGVGTARVIATSGTVSDTCLVTVTNAPVFLDITRAGDTLTSLGDSFPAPIVMLNARGDTLAPSSAQWSSDVPLVAPVTGAGVVIARDTGGTVVRAKAARAPGDTLRDSIGIRVVNLPAAVVLSDDRDTLTALGQSVAYTGAVLNGRGNVISGYPIVWSSTNPAVVTVSPSGVVTAVALGGAFVIGRAGSVADTVVDVVLNPTRLVVDNTTVVGPRFGTLKRPYAKIRDGVNAADVDDTVLVRKGVAPYSETVALTRRVTLLGDDSAFALSVPRNPLLLPLVSHDTGAAGSTAYTTATVSSRTWPCDTPSTGRRSTRGAPIFASPISTSTRPAPRPDASDRGSPWTAPRHPRPPSRTATSARCAATASACATRPASSWIASPFRWWTRCRARSQAPACACCAAVATPSASPRCGARKGPRSWWIRAPARPSR